MEVVDVGTRPADEVVELLFEGGVLKSLLGYHGAGCFVLVRSMAAPGFYRELIANSSTLDQTTRRHVAFVVFYGDRSGIVRERHRYGAYGKERYGEKTRLDGLSINDDPEVGQGEEPEVLFPPGVSDVIRYSPDMVDSHVFEHQMSRVATRLMDKYDIPESALPCLLFTDGSDFERHLIVPLDRDDPLKSLYQHVLSPLSEQFGSLSKYWKRRESLPLTRSDVERAEVTVTRLPGEIKRIEAEIETQRPLVKEQRAAIQVQLDKLSRVKAQREDERASIVLHQANMVQNLREQLQAIAAGERTFRSAGEKSLEKARLEKRLFREQQRLNTYEQSSLTREARRISGLEYTLKTLEWRISDLERKKKNGEDELARAQATLEKWTPEKLLLESTQIQAIETELESEGYGDEVVRTDRPSAFAAIEAMHRTGKLGVRRDDSVRKVTKPMRILFLAANPITTTALDLEEELRSLENELRGVKYRDQVVLTARYAVRPDDLIRHVRSERPTVVHFSGHGSGVGIMLRNDEGGYTEVTGPSLKRFFADRGVDLVVLNACFSKAQAEMLPGSVKAVVGTTDAVDDVDARRFTVAFYRALGEGLTIAEAFRDGGDAVVLDNGEDVFWSAGQLDEVLVSPTTCIEGF